MREGRIGSGKMRGWRSLRGSAENLQSILEMVVGEFAEEFTPNKASPIRNVFVVTVT